MPPTGRRAIAGNWRVQCSVCRRRVGSALWLSAELIIERVCVCGGCRACSNICAANLDSALYCRAIRSEL